VTGGALSPNTDNKNEESSWTSSLEPFSFSFLVLYVPLVPHERDVGENDERYRCGGRESGWGLPGRCFLLSVVWIWISTLILLFVVVVAVRVQFPVLMYTLTKIHCLCHYHEQSDCYLHCCMWPSEVA
jgi:hypothetical protein